MSGGSLAHGGGNTNKWQKKTAPRKRHGLITYGPMQAQANTEPPMLLHLYVEGTCLKWHCYCRRKPKSAPGSAGTRTARKHTQVELGDLAVVIIDFRLCLPVSSDLPLV